MTRALRAMIVVLPLLSAGCDLTPTIQGMGDYMPTIGDRCESTECITPSGKAASDAIKAEKLRAAQQAASQKNGTPMPPAPTPANDPYDTVEPF